MLKCGEIEENIVYRDRLLKEIERKSIRDFIVIVCLSMICILLVTYIFYDRKKDSEVNLTATETTTVVQDGSSHNSYIDGEGDIVNRADSKETDCKKAERK